jgi:hypothetical protein
MSIGIPHPLVVVLENYTVPSSANESPDERRMAVPTFRFPRAKK